MAYLTRLLILLVMMLGLPGVAGAITFNGGTVSNCTFTSSSNTYSCTSSFDASQDLTIASGYKVQLATSLNLAWAQRLTMSGTAQLSVSGDLNIGNTQASNLSVSGGSLIASGQFLMNGQVQNITANINAASMTFAADSKVTGSLTASGQITTGSRTVITGDMSAGSMKLESDTQVTGALSASGQIRLESRTVIGGAVSGSQITTSSSVQLKGGVTATQSFTLESASTVTGNVVAPVVELKPSSLRVNGNITATTSLIIGSGNSVDGNVTAGYVELQSSEAYITGNATVNSIKLNWHGRVYQNIYCPAPTPGAPCNCVTNDSGYYNSDNSAPKCGTAAPPATSVHHYQITHDGNGLTCQPETVTVRACANAACTTLYNGNATVQMSPFNGGSPSFLIASTDGANNASVRQTTAVNNVDLGIASATPTATNATTCVNSSGGTSCKMNFYDAGFQLSADDKKSGDITPFRVEALQNNNATPSSCIPLIASKTVPLAMRCAYVNPNSNNNSLSRNVNLTNANSSSSATLVCANGSSNIGAASSGSLQMSFDSSGKAQGSLIYDDVGQLALSAEYTSNAAPYPNLVTGTSSPFLIVPHTYRIAANLGSTANPAATTATGTVFTKAGTPFNVVVTTVSKNGVITTNFGKESSPGPGLFTLAHALVAPSGGDMGALGGPAQSLVNAIATGAASSTPGVFTLTGMSWSEVGIMKLTAATVTTGPNSGLYTGLPTDLIGTGDSGNIGRFIPDHFDTVLIPPDSVYTVPMACPASGFPISCAGGLFVYSGQPLQLAVQAKNGASSPATTKNYTGSYARALAITAWNAAGATGSANSNPEWQPVTGAQSSVTPSATKGLITTAQVAFPTAPPSPMTSLGNGLGIIAYAFTNNFGNTNALNTISRPVNVYFRATETSPGGDGVTSLRTGAVEAGIAVASGRLVVGNAYGSELLRQRVPLSAEYWTGTQFQRNLADVTQSPTVLSASNVTYSGCTKNLAASSSNGCYTGLSVYTPPATLNFSYGASWLRLNAPGAGRNGTVQVRVNPIPWLPSTPGSITYGVFRSPLTYMREVY